MSSRCVTGSIYRAIFRPVFGASKGWRLESRSEPKHQKREREREREREERERNTAYNRIVVAGEEREAFFITHKKNN